MREESYYSDYSKLKCKVLHLSLTFRNFMKGKERLNLLILAAYLCVMGCVCMGKALLIENYLKLEHTPFSYSVRT